MRLRFFSIPAAAPDAAEAALNQFLAAHRISHVERQLVADGAASFWAVCVTWVEGGAEAPPPADAARRTRGLDYRELLAADEFALYDRLRGLRRQQAEAEGLPTYAVFTNEQLAAMVRSRAQSAGALAAIDGVGEARVRRYGDAFLALLRDGVPRLAPAVATPAAATPAAAPP